MTVGPILEARALSKRFGVVVAFPQLLKGLIA